MADPGTPVDANPPKTMEDVLRAYEGTTTPVEADTSDTPVDAPKSMEDVLRAHTQGNAPVKPETEELPEPPAAGQGDADYAKFVEEFEKSRRVDTEELDLPGLFESLSVSPNSVDAETIDSHARALGYEPDEFRKHASNKGVNLSYQAKRIRKGAKPTEVAEGLKRLGTDLTPVKRPETEEYDSEGAADPELAKEFRLSKERAGFGGSDDEFRELTDAGKAVAKAIMDDVRADGRAITKMNIYGDHEQGFRAYTLWRTQDLMERSGIDITDDNFNEAEMAAIKQAMKEMAAAKMEGTWTAPIFLPASLNPNHVPGFWDAAKPTVEVIGMNADNQIILRQEGAAQWAFDMADMPQAGLAGIIMDYVDAEKHGEDYDWDIGKSAVSGFANRRHALEVAKEIAPSDPYYMATALGFAVAVAFPDMFEGVGPLMRASKKLSRELKLAGGIGAEARAIDLLEEIATAGYSSNYEKIQDAETALRKEFPQLADELDIGDSNLAAHAVETYPEIADVPYATSLPGITGENAHILHPAWQAKWASRTSDRGTTRGTKNYDALYNTGARLADVATSRKSIGDMVDPVKRASKLDSTYAKRIAKSRKAFAAVDKKSTSGLFTRLEQATHRAIENPSQWEDDMHALISKRYKKFKGDDHIEMRRDLHHTVRDMAYEAKRMNAKADVSRLDRAEKLIKVNREMRTAAAAALRDSIRGVSPEDGLFKQIWGTTAQDTKTPWLRKAFRALGKPPADIEVDVFKGVSDTLAKAGINIDPADLRRQYKADGYVDVEKLGHKVRKLGRGELSDEGEALVTSFKTHFNMSEKEARATATVVDAHASYWANREGRSVSEWYATRIAEVRTGLPTGDGEVLYSQKFKQDILVRMDEEFRKLGVDNMEMKEAIEAIVNGDPNAYHTGTLQRRVDASWRSLQNAMADADKLAGVAPTHRYIRDRVSLMKALKSRGQALTPELSKALDDADKVEKLTLAFIKARDAYRKSPTLISGAGRPKPTVKDFKPPGGEYVGKKARNRVRRKAKDLETGVLSRNNKGVVTAQEVPLSKVKIKDPPTHATHAEVDALIKSSLIASHIDPTDVNIAHARKNIDDTWAKLNDPTEEGLAKALVKAAKSGDSYAIRVLHGHEPTRGIRSVDTLDPSAVSGDIRYQVDLDAWEDIESLVRDSIKRITNNRMEHPAGKWSYSTQSMVYEVTNALRSRDFGRIVDELNTAIYMDKASGLTNGHGDILIRTVNARFPGKIKEVEGKDPLFVRSTDSKGQLERVRVNVDEAALDQHLENLTLKVNELIFDIDYDTQNEILNNLALEVEKARDATLKGERGTLNSANPVWGPLAKKLDYDKRHEISLLIAGESDELVNLHDTHPIVDAARVDETETIGSSGIAKQVNELTWFRGHVEAEGYERIPLDILETGVTKPSKHELGPGITLSLNPDEAIKAAGGAPGAKVQHFTEDGHGYVMESGLTSVEVELTKVLDLRGRDALPARLREAGLDSLADTVDGIPGLRSRSVEAQYRALLTNLGESPNEFRKAVAQDAARRSLDEVINIGPSGLTHADVDRLSKIPIAAVVVDSEKFTKLGINNAADIALFIHDDARMLTYADQWEHVVIRKQWENLTGLKAVPGIKSTEGLAAHSMLDEDLTDRFLSAMAKLDTETDVAKLQDAVDEIEGSVLEQLNRHAYAAGGGEVGWDAARRRMPQVDELIEELSVTRDILGDTVEELLVHQLVKAGIDGLMLDGNKLRIFDPSGSTLEPARKLIAKERKTLIEDVSWSRSSEVFWSPTGRVSSNVRNAGTTRIAAQRLATDAESPEIRAASKYLAPYMPRTESFAVFYNLSGEEHRIHRKYPWVHDELVAPSWAKMRKEEIGGFYAWGMGVISSPHEAVVIHELTHAATNYRLHLDTPRAIELNGKLDKVRDAVREAMSSRQATDELLTYGLQNNDEFLSELFSNHQFRELLRATPYERDVSMWDTIMTWLSDVFGVKAGDQDALAEGLDLADKLLREIKARPADDMMRAKQQAKVRPTPIRTKPYEARPKRPTDHVGAATFPRVDRPPTGQAMAHRREDWPRTLKEAGEGAKSHDWLAEGVGQWRTYLDDQIRYLSGPMYALTDELSPEQTKRVWAFLNNGEPLDPRKMPDEGLDAFKMGLKLETEEARENWKWVESHIRSIREAAAEAHLMFDKLVDGLPPHAVKAWTYHAYPVSERAFTSMHNWTFKGPTPSPPGWNRRRKQYKAESPDAKARGKKVDVYDGKAAGDDPDTLFSKPKQDDQFEFTGPLHNRQVVATMEDRLRRAKIAAYKIEQYLTSPDAAGLKHTDRDILQQMAKNFDQGAIHYTGGATLHPDVAMNVPEAIIHAVESVNSQRISLRRRAIDILAAKLRDAGVAVPYKVNLYGRGKFAKFYNETLAAAYEGRYGTSAFDAPGKMDAEYVADLISIVEEVKPELSRLGLMQETITKPRISTELSEFVKDAAKSTNRNPRRLMDDIFDDYDGNVDAWLHSLRGDMAAATKPRGDWDYPNLKAIAEKHRKGLARYGNAAKADPEEYLQKAGKKGKAMDAKAAVIFQKDGSSIIAALKSPDISSALHEFAHVFRRDLLPHQMQQVRHWLVNNVETWEGVKFSRTESGPGSRIVSLDVDGGKFVGSAAQVRAAEEAFARAFERHLRDGRSEVPILQAVFEDLKKWLKKIYAKVTGSEIDIEISEKMRNLFDDIVTPVDVKTRYDVNELGDLQRKLEADQIALRGEQGHKPQVHGETSGSESSKLTQRISQELTYAHGEVIPDTPLSTKGRRAAAQMNQQIDRAVMTTMFGGDPDKLLRQFPEEARLRIKAGPRLVRQSYSDAVRLVSERDPVKVAKYLGGEAVTLRRGEQVVSSGSDLVGPVAGQLRRWFNSMTDKHKLALIKVAERLNEPGEWHVRGIPGYANAMDSFLVGGKNMPRFLQASMQALAAHGLSARHGVAEARALEAMLYVAGVTKRNGSTFVGKGAERATILLNGIEEGFGPQASAKIAVLAAGHGQVTNVHKMWSGMGLFLDEGLMDAYRAFVSAEAVEPRYVDQVRKIVRRLGLHADFADPETWDMYRKMYLPEAARDALATALEHPVRTLGKAHDKLESEGTADKLLRMALRFWKNKVTRGAWSVRQTYYTMNTFDNFSQLGMSAGFAPSFMNFPRVAVQNFSALPGFGLAMYGMEAAANVGRRGKPRVNVTESVRHWLQGIGDKGSHVVGRMVSDSKWHIGVNDVLEGRQLWKGEKSFTFNNRVYTPQQVRDVFVQEGVFSSFDVTALKSVVARTATMDAKKFLDEGRSVGNVLEDMLGATTSWSSDIAEAWSMRERVGTAITLMELGLDPRTAARLTVESLYDYGGSMSAFDRSWVMQIVFPFWAYQKNANRQVMDSIFDWKAAYRMGVIRRAQHLGPEALSQIVYSGAVDDYGIAEEQLGEDSRALYYSLRTEIEKVYGNPDDVPFDVKVAIRAIMSSTRKPVIKGNVYELGDNLRPGITGPIGGGYVKDAGEQAAAYPGLVEPAHLPHYYRDRAHITITPQRKEMTAKWFERKSPSSPSLSLILPDSTIDAGMSHVTNTAATMLLGINELSRATLGVAPGGGDREGASFTRIVEPLSQVTDLSRAPGVSYVASIYDMNTMPPARIHPSLAALMFDGVDIKSYPAVSDPWSGGDDIDISGERTYIRNGTQSLIFKMSPLSGLNDLLLAYERTPLEDVAAQEDLRVEMLRWARVSAGLKTVETDADSAATRAETWFMRPTTVPQD